jgi:FtsP/CotA-like multicopper oxidase with cupredoxin domain
MAGLVLGISVRSPPGWRATENGEVRRLRLYVQEGRPTRHAYRAMSFVLQRGPLPPAPDSTEIPGATLVLTRGQPTEVTVINRLAEGTSVHWHGLELESYSDGVAGWSGSGTHPAPVIMPGDSFVAHLTLHRAGTFIYHTHLNDYLQLTSGLYGPIVVLEPGRQFDPATDHVYTLGRDGEDDPPHLIVNGDSLSAPLALAAGTVHRFRFVHIGMAARLRFSLRQDRTLMTWRPLAMDGADLPPAASREVPATVLIDVGQTADFEFRPPGAGTYSLVLMHGERLFWSQQLLVR